jgi:hypothetical protein
VSLEHDEVFMTLQRLHSDQIRSTATREHQHVSIAHHRTRKTVGFPSGLCIISTEFMKAIVDLLITP